MPNEGLTVTFKAHSMPNRIASARDVGAVQSFLTVSDNWVLAAVARAKCESLAIAKSTECSTFRDVRISSGMVSDCKIEVSITDGAR